jgi:hypothetical protein
MHGLHTVLSPDFPGYQCDHGIQDAGLVIQYLRHLSGQEAAGQTEDDGSHGGEQGFHSAEMEGGGPEDGDGGGFEELDPHEFPNLAGADHHGVVQMTPNVRDEI